MNNQTKQGTIFGIAQFGDQYTRLRTRFNWNEQKLEWKAGQPVISE